MIRKTEKQRMKACQEPNISPNHPEYLQIIGPILQLSHKCIDQQPDIAFLKFRHRRNAFRPVERPIKS